MADQPRIAPLPPRQWPPEMREALAPLTPPTPRRADQPKGLNVLGMLAWHPGLAAAYNQLTSHALYRSTLTDRQRELVILRMAMRRGGEYVWTQHSVIAGDVGITENEVARLAAPTIDPAWSALERAIVAAVDDLVADSCISDDTWTALRSELGEQQILDLIFVVGTYSTLVMATRSCGIELDDDLRPR